MPRPGSATRRLSPRRTLDVVVSSVIDEEHFAVVQQDRSEVTEPPALHVVPIYTVAIGYARYLDIRGIQEATERKSAFLASMSHELRTLMNAIKGFANLVLRRGDELTDRNRENIGKIDQASDHLMTMINDLLDLSKIEAGRMDVNPERFDVRELVTSACDTVSPLIQEGVELR